MEQSTNLPIPSPAAIFKPLTEGGVVFSTESEAYFGVNVVGARIWSLLPPVTRTFDELVQRLASEYSDVKVAQIRQDVRAFLTTLLENGLVTPAPGNAASDPQFSKRSSEAP